jgi:hypothetical protein
MQATTLIVIYLIMLAILKEVLDQDLLLGNFYLNYRLTYPNWIVNLKNTSIWNFLRLL